jgi:hypothetical protein
VWKDTETPESGSYGVRDQQSSYLQEMIMVSECDGIMVLESNGDGVRD